MSPRKPVDQQLERNTILNVARDLFVEKGYRGVSMRQIAATLNVSHGAIYYHFQNKASLLYSIVAEDFSLLDQELEKVMNMGISDKEKLIEIFMAYIKFGVTHSKHYEIMFLIKDENINTLMNRGPNESYEKFAKAVYQLCGPQVLTPQKMWSIFLSLHGFVTHYIKCEETFENIKGIATSHAEFILTTIEI
ncbi:TetR/AcrR family transcriptional regulator [Tenuibacillus multivorans]|uniref:TetR/AcrR family transcriptional regulator n=1 Tax=Tenuibacillus multivorans TaxID=237069 RepID=UPI000B89793B